MRQRPARRWTARTLRLLLISVLMLFVSLLSAILVALLHPIIGPELRRMLIDRYLTRRSLAPEFPERRPTSQEHAS